MVRSSEDLRLLLAGGEKTHGHEAVAVVGLGYTGLPLAIAFAEAGFQVVGIDVSAERVGFVSRGESYLVDVPPERYAAAQGRLTAHLPDAAPSNVAATVICVPTPLTSSGSPDLSHVLDATAYVAARICCPQLVVLQSTTYPGTTEEVVLPLLRDVVGGNAGEAFFLGYAPERIDPGNARYNIRNIPKLVSGVTDLCRRHTRELFATVVDDVVEVGAPRVAEAAKLYENTFRAVNIALANEMAVLCDGLEIPGRDVIAAAGTKPFGFMPHFPGPGPGGDCIPAAPRFLSWRAKQHGLSAPLIDAALEVNEGMPAYVCGKIAEALAARKKSVAGSSVLLLGMAYKRDVADFRCSPGVAIMEILLEDGATVRYCDPHVPHLAIGGRTHYRVEWSEAEIVAADCVVIVTAHRLFLDEPLFKSATTIVDAQGILAARDGVWTV